VNPLTSVFPYPVLPQEQFIGVGTQLVPAIAERRKTLGAPSDVQEQAMKELPGCHNRRHPSVCVRKLISNNKAVNTTIFIEKIICF